MLRCGLFFFPTTPFSLILCVAKSNYSGEKCLVWNMQQVAARFLFSQISSCNYQLRAGIALLPFELGAWGPE